MMPEHPPRENLDSVLAKIAPGTALRDGLERILRGRTGALIVLGSDKAFETLYSGGFTIEIDFSPTQLRELAKMDGAIINDRDSTKILRAGVQLMPDASIETQESGTRHRTAERIAIQTGFPVISVSQSMRTITVYIGRARHMVQDTESLLAQANQALATLERYRDRLDYVTRTLSTLEIESMVTVRDVALVLQRQEMVRRISDEITHYILELGVDGRLLTLQLEELTSGVAASSEFILFDYLKDASDKNIESALSILSELNAQKLADLGKVAVKTRLISATDSLDTLVFPRGFRMLHEIPGISPQLSQRLIKQFESLQALMAANVKELMRVDGIGENRAQALREGLSKIIESSLAPRHDHSA